MELKSREDFFKSLVAPEEGGEPIEENQSTDANDELDPEDEQNDGTVV